MNSPLCSVVIPTYNALDYLPAAFASIFAQGIEDIEILVLDDGSSDGTRAWLAEQALVDGRIRVFHGERSGPACARNQLIEQAKSSLIAFLDADDTWLAGKLAPEIAYHRANPDVAFTFTDYRHVDLAGNLRSTCFDYWKPKFGRSRTGFERIDNARAELFACNLVGTSCVVAKREALHIANGFSADLPSAEDWDLWLRLAECGPVAMSRDVTMHYLMRPGSETANRGARIAAMNDLITRFGTGDMPGWAQRAARARLWSSKAHHASERDLKGFAALYAARAFASDPSKRMLREMTAMTRQWLFAKERSGDCPC